MEVRLLSVSDLTSELSDLRNPKNLQRLESRSRNVGESAITLLIGDGGIYYLDKLLQDVQKHYRDAISFDALNFLNGNKRLKTDVEKIFQSQPARVSEIETLSIPYSSIPISSKEGILNYFNIVSPYMEYVGKNLQFQSSYIPKSTLISLGGTIKIKGSVITDSKLLFGAGLTSFTFDDFPGSQTNGMRFECNRTN